MTVKIKVLKFTLLIYLLMTASCSTFDSQKSFSAQTYRESRKLMGKALRDGSAYDMIESLTTEVGPRPAGSKAEKRARDWATDKMKALGLKNVHVEEFDVEHWKRVTEKAEILSPNPQALRITSLGGSVSTPTGGIKGEVVRFEDFKALENAPMKGLENKIAFIDEPMARTKDGSGYSLAVVKRRRSTIEAGKRGALAALIRSVGTDTHRFPHTGQTGYQEGIKKIPIAALSGPDADQLRRSLSKGTVRVALKMKVRSLGMRKSGNVVGEIPGESGRIVLAGAHLDSWDLGTGAVDDGAGVGIVLGAARVILEEKIKPKHTIRIVLFGSEEVGLIGAKAYAKKHKNKLQDHRVAAESDFGAGKIWKLDTGFSEQGLLFGKALVKALRPLGIKKGTNEAYGGPDLIPIRDLGVPVVTLKQNGWDYFDLHHTEDDTFDKIKPESIAQNVAAYTVFLWMSSNSDVELRNRTTKEE